MIISPATRLFLSFAEAVPSRTKSNFLRMSPPMFKRNLLSVLGLGTFVGLATGSQDTLDEEDWGALDKGAQHPDIAPQSARTANNPKMTQMSIKTVSNSSFALSLSSWHSGRRGIQTWDWQRSLICDHWSHYAPSASCGCKRLIQRGSEERREKRHI